MLDQLVDVEEDERTGQNNLLLCYHSAEETARRMGALAREAIAQAEALQPRSEAIRHSLIVAAMAAMYLAAPESRAPHVLDARSAVLRELGPLARLAIGVFRLSGRDGGPERAPDPAAALESQASESPLVGERGLCEVAAGR
jgi:hypothetical protein